MNKTNHLESFLKKLFSIGIDLMTVAGIFSLSVLTKMTVDPELPLAEYFKLWPFLFVFWIVFEKAGLYEGISFHTGSALGPIEEIRRLFYAVSAIFITVGCANFCYRPGDYLYSRSILFGSYLGCLITLPVTRLLFRKLCIRLGCWGVPAIIIGSGKTAQRVFNNLWQDKQYGLRPIGYFTDSPARQMMPDQAVFLGNLCDIARKARSLGVSYAILAKDTDVESPDIQSIIRRYGVLFPHLLLIPRILLHTCSGVVPKDIGGTLGLEVQHNLQIPHIYWIKKIIDFSLTIPCLAVAAPVMVLIALAIKLDSPGPVLFKHQRIAKAGKPVYIYKFRTMSRGADEELTDLLRENSELRDEFEIYGKLKEDPRVTRVGRWLRKTSLDELPQLLNVIQGRLTLVGPRPIIQQELEIYGESANLFDRVLPGITGLWQVSGRNNLTYEERARLDNHYVNNWSIWLDVYILTKTVTAVLLGRGAK